MMHAEARDGFSRMLFTAGVDCTARMNVLDLAGQNVNGVVHDLLPNATVTVLDIEDHPSVDIVADACTWEPDRVYDLVISTEGLEHIQGWREVIRTARLALDAGGVAVFTCASTGRPVHGATGASEIAPGEWYGNPHPLDLLDCLSWHFSDYAVEYRRNPGDAYMWGRV